MSRLRKGPVPHCRQSLHLQTKGEPLNCMQEMRSPHVNVVFRSLCIYCYFITDVMCCCFFLRVLNLHSQASPVTRAASMPPVETSYIPPPPPLIQDYRHYYHTTSDLPGKLVHCFKVIILSLSWQSSLACIHVEHIFLTVFICSANTRYETLIEIKNKYTINIHSFYYVQHVV